MSSGVTPQGATVKFGGGNPLQGAVLTCGLLKCIPNLSRLVSRSVGRSAGRSFGRSVSRLEDWLVLKSVGCMCRVSIALLLSVCIFQNALLTIWFLVDAVESDLVSGVSLQSQRGSSGRLYFYSYTMLSVENGHCFLILWCMAVKAMSHEDTSRAAHETALIPLHAMNVESVF